MNWTDAWYLLNGLTVLHRDDKQPYTHSHTFVWFVLFLVVQVTDPMRTTCLVDSACHPLLQWQHTIFPNS